MNKIEAIRYNYLNVLNVVRKGRSNDWLLVKGGVFIDIISRENIGSSIELNLGKEEYIKELERSENGLYMLYDVTWSDAVISVSICSSYLKCVDMIKEYVKKDCGYSSKNGIDIDIKINDSNVIIVRDRDKVLNNTKYYEFMISNVKIDEAIDIYK